MRTTFVAAAYCFLLASVDFALAIVNNNNNNNNNNILIAVVV
jgi:hypothetical protein